MIRAEPLHIFDSNFPFVYTESLSSCESTRHSVLSVSNLFINHNIHRSPGLPCKLAVVSQMHISGWHLGLPEDSLIVRRLAGAVIGKPLSIRAALESTSAALLVVRNWSSRSRLMGVKTASSSAKARHPIRVLLADRTPMDCQLLAASLRSSNAPCKIVGTASSALAALAILKQDGVQVALVNPCLAEGPLAGFDLVREMRDSFPAVRAIMVLTLREPRLVVSSFQAGAQGIFFRDRPVQTLPKCIAVVHSGQIWAGTAELHIILQAIAERPRFKPVNATDAKPLTGRESEVATLVAEGLRNHEISERLKLSPHTIKNYLYRVYEKLGIASRVELTMRVMERGRTEADSENPPRHEHLAG